MNLSVVNTILMRTDTNKVIWINERLMNILATMAAWSDGRPLESSITTFVVSTITPRKISDTARFSMKIVDCARFFISILWMKMISIMFNIIERQALVGLTMKNVIYCPRSMMMAAKTRTSNA